MTDYGVTSKGFVAKTQQQVISELNAQFQSTFGGNINLGAQSIFGQLIGIFSEREALLWALAEAVYNSQYPAGAEGTAVDNILALNNLKRLTPRATVTNPSPVTLANGMPLYGLVLYGTAGTTIPAGSLIKADIVPQKNFSLDSAVVIAAAANATQTVYFSNNPDSGAFILTFTGAGGNDVSTAYIPYNADPALTTMSWTTAPLTGNFVLMLNGLVSTTSLSYTSTAANITTAIRAIDPIYSAVTVTGSFNPGFTINWSSVSQPTISLNGDFIGWSATPTPGTFTIRLNGSVDTAPLSTTATAAEVQAAIRQAGGANYASVMVGPYAVAPVTKGWAINWMSSGVTPSVAFGVGGTGAPQQTGKLWTIINPNVYLPSVTQIINGTFDSTAKTFPYTDVAVSGAAHPFLISFGSKTPLSGQPSSAAMGQPQARVSYNNMLSGANITNVSTAIQSQGSPAQGIGSATCTTMGPILVTAGQLDQIGTPVSGWTGVNNQLDCITGADTETDNEALQRRINLLSSQANGTLSAIIARVSQVQGVTEVSGFQNTSDAALQSIVFETPPANSTTFQLQMPSYNTSPLPNNVTAAAMQSAIRAITDMNRVLVIGSVSQGFLIDFNGTQGGQSQPLIAIANNTTTATITTRFDRAPKSFEIVADGGQPNDIAAAIQATQPAGIVSYGSATRYTTANVTAGSTVLTSVATTQGVSVGQTVFGSGMPTNALVASIGTGTVTLSAPALATGTGVALRFGWSAQVSDQFANASTIQFSRPIPVILYVSVSLTTDQYVIPGSSASGLNPLSKFSPASISTIQNELVAIANAVPIGGVVIGYGTNGLIGAFNDISGILGYTLFFGTLPSPSTNTNIQLMPIESASLQTFNIAVQYT